MPTVMHAAALFWQHSRCWATGLAYSRADLFLRSGCELVQVEESISAVKRGGSEDELSFGIEEAKALFKEALKKANEQGLEWHDGETVFTARENLQRALEANLIA